eukprot:6160481-Pyramimonas_sp.AAC.1
MASGRVRGQEAGATPLTASASAARSARYYTDWWNASFLKSLRLGLEDNVIQRLREGGEGGRLVTGCFAFHDVELPRMDLGTQACVVTIDGHDVDEGPEDMVQHAVPSGTEEIEFAIDGSCTKPALLELQRAGWATVLLNPHGTDALRVMYAAVPASLPQTSAMA